MSIHRENLNFNTIEIPGKIVFKDIYLAALHDMRGNNVDLKVEFRPDGRPITLFIVDDDETSAKICMDFRDRDVKVNLRQYTNAIRAAKAHMLDARDIALSHMGARRNESGMDQAL